jgi:enoyl-CoA hydratase
MTYEHLRHEQRGPVTLITIDRPERMNAIGPRTHAELVDAGRASATTTRRSSASSPARATGPCARAATSRRRRSRSTTPSGPPTPAASAPASSVPRAGPALHKPTIAAVNGVAYAGGSEWVCWADLAIADAHATFGVTWRRWNIGLADGGTQRLPRIVGHRRALELIITGRVIGAEEGARDRARQRGGAHGDLRGAGGRAGRAHRRPAAARDPHGPRGRGARLLAAGYALGRRLG